MSEQEIRDNIGLLNEKLEDVSYLIQEIREEYFEKYDGKNEKDMLGLSWDHNRYASLYRILDSCIYEVAAKLREMDGAISKQKKAVAA